MTVPDPRLGTTVGNYRLLEELGRGGMGVVYLAEHVYIGKQVAVKVLHDRYAGKDEAVQRFLQEARAASLINHPNIVDVTDFGEAPDGTVFFVMENLKGEPLDVTLRRERRLPLLRTITILNQMTRALGAAHAMGIVHRDLKPENVVLTTKPGRRELVRRWTDATGEHATIEREASFDFVKILDFGVAKIMEPGARRVTQQGMVMGTPEYMAPETARTGKADARSDIYALGVMFYEMLTGKLPFEGESAVDVMMRAVSEPVRPPRLAAPDAEITEAAEAVVMRALEKDPDRRQQTMADLYDELQTCYGAVGYRRTATRIPGEALPTPRPSPETLAPHPARITTPILLTKVKARAVPSSPFLPSSPLPPESRELDPRPLPLTKKKAPS